MADQPSIRWHIDGEWCLHWSHSVTGGAVADCFVGRDGQLFLTRSFLHDAAAGLGHIPGRGVLRDVPGGYWIDGIDEPLPGNRLRLRVGGPTVGHELRSGDQVIPLSEQFSGQRIELRWHPEE
ncbi:DUF1850 domain-containing protein [Halodurantibacterium flavum]|uniref:DUF1850 domain-containing protein n=1 Tax=Halodurantibacterium flavum TaxID=1382802 RepID=A0ABW4S9G3_9RHOB